MNIIPFYSTSVILTKQWGRTEAE